MANKSAAELDLREWPSCNFAVNVKVMREYARMRLSRSFIRIREALAKKMLS